MAPSWRYTASISPRSRPPYALVPSLPVSVEEVVMTALAKDPRRRFANMRAFANALEQAYLISRPPAPTHISQFD